MTKEEKNVFSLRIANSSKTELIVITYDIIVNYVNAATHAYSVEDLDLVVFNLQKAKQFLNNLSIKYLVSIKSICYNLIRDK